MLKAKNIFIITAIGYGIMLGVSVIGELISIGDKAQHIQNMVRTASDMALEQTQVTDDFFVKAGMGDDFTPYRIKLPSNDGMGYKEMSMYNGLYNKSENIAKNREDIYSMLYNTSDFRSYANKLGNVRTPLRYLDQTQTRMLWYSVPRVAQVGTNILDGGRNSIGVTLNGGSVIPSVANELYANYGMDTYKKTNGDTDYYVTPISLGLTYVNKDLLGRLFMNNMDLLMRSKYTMEGVNLNSEEGGKGLLKGEYYADTITNDLSSQNPINDGKFTLLRGEKATNSNNSVEVFKGVEPKVTYKVIDMYDSTNDRILTSIFGANKKSGDGVTHKSKASYLKHLDRDRINPETGRPFDSKPIVVAEVTFYADIVVPYSMLFMKELRQSSTDSHFLDIERRGTTGIEGKSGSDLFSYTRYFAVTP